MKKSNFGLFFKKLPDDYLFESMIIFCIFFWAIPIFYFPRDIKFDLSSVPAQCGGFGNPCYYERLGDLYLSTTLVDKRSLWPAPMREHVA